jgi:DNA-binding XRE family transcriptional regulator
VLVFGIPQLGDNRCCALMKIGVEQTLYKYISSRQCKAALLCRISQYPLTWDAESGNFEKFMATLNQESRHLNSGMEAKMISNRENFPLLKALGQAIQERRLKLNLSQKDLAEEAGVDRAYISNIEQAKRNPSLSALRSLAQGLRTRLSKLIGSAEKIENESNS